MNPLAEYHTQQTRRAFLRGGALGLGGIALGSMLNGQAASRNAIDGLANLPQFAPKAKRVIYLFQSGGPSQLALFAPKPHLAKRFGEEVPESIYPAERKTTMTSGQKSFPCAPSTLKFAQHGQAGTWLSDAMPHLAKCIDEVCVIKSMHTEAINHDPAAMLFQTGSVIPGRPSMGAWVSYGLGSANRNMPGYVVIQDPRGAPVNGAAIWSNGYLPAAHQGTLLRPSGTPILNLESPDGIGRIRQRREMDALQWLNRRHLAKRGGDSELEARISAYELAFRMQTEAPDLMNISGEPQHIRDLYGLDNGTTAGFGRQCLLARRMVESGVRHTLLVHGVQITNMSWDDHGDVKGGMIRHCSEVDRPVAGLLADLKQRGLLDETLVVWASEMGRTPFRNGGMSGNPGREHNSWALTMWMAGGDVKGGTTVGATDEFSLRGSGDTIHVRDVHATILDLMGLDQEAVNYQHAGRIRKLTDIGGRVLKDIVG